MGSIMRYRSGVVNYIALPTANDGAVANAIEVGDLVCCVGGVAYPAGNTTIMTDGGNGATNRAAFAAAFAGVAVQKIGLQTGETSFKLTTDPGWVLVATSGDFEYPCAATSFAPGDMVGVYNNETSNSDQQVAKVTSTAEAIGIAKVPYNALGSSMTSVVVELRPKFTYDQVGSGL